jgi:hypothetical protein
MGLVGGIMAKLGLPSPINPMQARELTTNFPIPIQFTINEMGFVTNYKKAARHTVKWALQNEAFKTKIGQQ